MPNPKDMSDKELDGAIANIRKQLSGKCESLEGFLEVITNNDLNSLLQEKERRMIQGIKSINIDGIAISLDN